MKDIDAYINGKKIDIVICNYAYFCYKFPNLGLFEVKIIVNKTYVLIRLCGKFAIEYQYFAKLFLLIKFLSIFAMRCLPVPARTTGEPRQIS